MALSKVFTSGERLISGQSKSLKSDDKVLYSTTLYYFFIQERSIFILTTRALLLGWGLLRDWSHDSDQKLLQGVLNWGFSNLFRVCSWCWSAQEARCQKICAVMVKNVTSSFWLAKSLSEASIWLLAPSTTKSVADDCPSETDVLMKKINQQLKNIVSFYMICILNQVTETSKAVKIESLETKGNPIFFSGSFRLAIYLTDCDFRLLSHP